jgi:purine-binding chemotaxis protein CheW
MIDTSKEYLTFLLDKEEFGVDILCVQEIMVWSPVTEIPDAPDYLKGVINLRGVIVPIIDLRERFGNKATEYNSTTVVIVLRGIKKEKSVVVGLVVDAVSDVYKMEAADIKAMPDFGENASGQFLLGMGTVDEKLIMILDGMKLLSVDKLFQSNETLNSLAS